MLLIVLTFISLVYCSPENACGAGRTKQTCFETSPLISADSVGNGPCCWYTPGDGESGSPLCLGKDVAQDWKQSTSGASFECSDVAEQAYLSSLSQNWKYTNCGSSSDPIQILTFNVSPSPIVFGKNVSAQIHLTVANDLTMSNTGGIHVKLYKKELAWIPIPCIDKIGSCTYPGSWCEMIGKNNTGTQGCKIASQYGFPCQCPIKAGTYSANINYGPIPMPPPSVKWLASGSYKVEATVEDNNGNRLACIELELSVKK